MVKGHDKQEEDYSRMINGNTILLSLEGWIKYVQGFTKGLETTDKVSSHAVLDCIGEIMDYMVVFRKQLVELFLHCEEILEENEKLKQQLVEYENNKLLINNVEKA